MPKRTDRLDSEFRREIAAILAGPVKDKEPALSGLVSVTEVHVSPDLKTAKVYVSIFCKDPAEKKRSFQIICANAGLVRHHLAQRMRLRTVPSLTFLSDESMEYGSKMDELLSSLHKDET